MKQYIDLRIVGNEPELKEFLNLCCLISTFGAYGMSRGISVSVDGDGSGKLNFFNITKSKRKWPSNEVEILTYKEIEEVDRKRLQIYKVDIGE